MNNDADSLSGRPANAHPAIFAATAAILCYAITLAGGFAYDFYALSKDDANLRNPSQWGIYWTQSYNGGVDNLYRPLTSTFLAAESLVFGLDPSDTWKFHLVSCLLHVACCALVAELAMRLTNRRVAIVAGLLYAVHPIHVEAVCDIVGQAEMLCAIGMIGAMVLMLHRPMTKQRALAIFGCFILALLSKEQGMLLPLLLLVMMLCLHRCRPKEFYDRQPMRFLTLLLCWSLAAYIIVRERIVKFEWDRSFLDPAINPILLSHGKDRLLMPLVLIGHYLQLLIAPWKLSPDYSGDAIGSIAHLADPYLCLGIAAVIAWCGLTIIAFRRRAGVMLFCLLGVAITYGLIGNIVMIIGTNFAERLMYLPSVFFVILCSLGLSKLPWRGVITATTILVLLGTIRTVTYAHQWNDRLALYEQAARDQPGAVRMEMLLATEFVERGDNASALATLRNAQQKMLTYNELWDFSAALAIRIGDFNLAEQDLKRSNALGPSLRSASLEQKLADARADAKNAKSATQLAIPQK